MFVKNANSTDSSSVRYAVCRVLGYLGIVLNIFLFLSKYLIGLAAGSVAIKGDAVNNLTDSMSNIISILSFRFAEKPADREHPFGHERTETIAALFMGMIIVYLGVEMLKQSVEKIISPGEYHFEWAAVAVLILSICIKLYMYAYNSRYGKKYDSDLLKANAIDSRNDCIGTALILLSTLLSPVIHYDLDGVMGVIVSGIIFYSAWDLLKDVINSLLGEAPSEQTVNEMIDLLMESPMVIDVHDVAIHSYGPRYQYATAHVCVDGSLNLMDVHSEIDALEREISKEMNIETVLHVDPMLINDEKTNIALDLFGQAVNSINPEWSVQDFRIESGGENEKTGVYFDLIVPYSERHNLDDIVQSIQDNLIEPEKYSLYIRLVHPYS
jgi:cation diffusion facilitator family transporter